MSKNAIPVSLYSSGSQGFLSINASENKVQSYVLASNEFVDIDLQILLSGKFPETLCAEYAVANKTVAWGFRGFPEQANFTPTGV